MKKFILSLLMTLVIGTLALSNISLHTVSVESGPAAEKEVIICDYPDGVM